MPEKKPRQFGVVVKAQRSRKLEGFGEWMRVYTVNATDKPRRRKFFTHQALHQEIEELDKQGRLKQSTKVGSVGIKVNTLKKKLEVHAFYPFFDSVVGKHDVACFVRKQIAKELLKRYPKYKIKTRDWPSIELADHLMHMGIKPHEEYSLPEYLRILEGYEHDEEKRQVEWGKARWGVEVRPAKLLKKAFDGVTSGNYFVFVREKPPGTEGFLTHDKLHDTVEKLRKTVLKDSHEIGYVTIGAEHSKKLLKLALFYPLTPFGRDGGTEIKELRDHGIASHVRKEIVKDLMKVFPDYKIKSSREVPPKMMEHLGKRGIGPDKEYTLEEYLKLLEAYEAKHSV